MPKNAIVSYEVKMDLPEDVVEGLLQSDGVNRDDDAAVQDCILLAISGDPSFYLQYAIRDEVTDVSFFVS